MDVSAFGLVPHANAMAGVGDRFGRLVVLATGKRPGTYRYVAICQCDCGAGPLPVRCDQLKGGGSLSCGCARRQKITRHGFRSHPLYTAWHGMMARCYNPKNPRFADYGGRGITVCEAWHSVEAFVADMEDDYATGLELDRRDNELGYSPANCRWATHTEQAGNKRTVRMVTHDGRTMNLAEWAREVGLPHGTVLYRIKKLGWDPVRAITTPSLSPKERLALATRARWGSRGRG